MVLGLGRLLEVGVRGLCMDLASAGSGVLMVGEEMALGSSICEVRAVGYRVNDRVCWKACSSLDSANEDCGVEVQVIVRMVLVVIRMGIVAD